MKFRIGTFNLMNLLAPGATFYRETPYSNEEFERKSNWILQQLGNMKADFVGFQEIFDESTFVDLMRHYTPYKNAIVMAPGTTGRYPCVGFATTLPIIGVPEIITQYPKEAILSFDDQDIPIKAFTRPVLKVTVRLPNGVPCSIFITHLKSKRPMLRYRHPTALDHAIGQAKALLKRSTESLALRALVINELEGKDNPVIVLGDLNDTVNSVTSELISGSEPWHDLKKRDKERIWDVLLYNAYQIQAQNSSRDIHFSHIHNHKYETLDHIMVSQEFYPHNPRRIGKVEYLHFYNDHLVDSMLITPEDPRIYSDHGQLVAQIRLRKV